MMFYIIRSNFKSHHLRQLREWFELEWGHAYQFEDSMHGLIIPSPLLAIDGQNLIGGLAFTRYAINVNGEMRLWVNALFVAPGKRRVGVGTRLIRAAQNEAVSIQEKELFVHTGIPNLYQALGWTTVDSGERTVLKSTLGSVGSSTSHHCCAKKS